MPAIFLLGPDQWDDNVDVAPPAWVTALLGPEASPFQPHSLRLVLSALLERESRGTCRGIVMDARDQLPDEDEVDFFERLERTPGLAAYYFIVPARAKVIGTVFEEAMLRRDFKYGVRPRIVLFLEAQTVKRLEGGAFEFTEKGKRARYLRSVLRKAEHVELWETFDDLREAVLQRALIGES